MIRLARSEKPTEARDLAEARHALLVLPQLVVAQPAEHQDVAVVDEHRRRDRSLVRHEVDRARRAAADARRLLLDVELYAVAFVDLRLDLQPVPTSSRWIVVKGFTEPLLLPPLLFVYWPLMNGTSWPT